MAEMFNVAVSQSHALNSWELPFTFTGLLNVSLHVPVSSYSVAPQLHTSLYFPNHLLQHPQFCRLYVHDFFSQPSTGFGLPYTVTDCLASHVLDAALVHKGPFYLNAAVELPVGSSSVDGHDDGQNFQFIDDQLIIDQTTRRSSSSSRSRTRTHQTRTRTVDRLMMTTHERVVAEDDNNDNGELGGGCCICLEEFTAGTEFLRFGCKHAYHQSCIVKWLKSQNSCPLCRRPL